MLPGVLKKNAIRQRMIQQRAAMDPEEHARANHAIQAAILRCWREEWRTVLVYVNRADEVATVPLILERIERGTRLCVPAFDRGLNRYYPSELRDFETELESGGFGILEPKPSARRPAPIQELDAIFLPCLACDRQGNRLGYGYGYFDRICRSARAIKIGLAYEFQIVDAIPMHDGDVPLDMIVTEKEVIECPRA